MIDILIRFHFYFVNEELVSVHICFILINFNLNSSAPLIHKHVMQQAPPPACLDTPPLLVIGYKCVLAFGPTHFQRFSEITHCTFKSFSASINLTLNSDWMSCVRNHVVLLMN